VPDLAPDRVQWPAGSWFPIPRYWSQYGYIRDFLLACGHRSDTATVRTADSDLPPDGYSLVRTCPECGTGRVVTDIRDVRFT